MSPGKTSAREDMLNGAVELFRRQGVDGTALSDIVKRSGAPRGSLYHYFPDGKAQLAAEATTKAGQLMLASLNKLLTSGSLAEAITRFIGYFRAELVRTDFTSGCPIAAGALEGGEAPGAREAAGEVFTVLESTLSAALCQQGIPVERAERLATVALTAVEGALMVAKAQRSTRALDRVEEQLRELLDS